MPYEIKEATIPTGPDAGAKYYEVHKDGERQVGYCTAFECETYIASMADHVKLSACCGAPIGWDAWIDSNGDVCGGPFDDSCCMGCGGENPKEAGAESVVTP